MTNNALEILKQDHLKVKELLSQLAKTTVRGQKTRQKLINEIGEELRIHTKLEEKIFYPAFKEAGKKSDESLFYEAKEEHKAVEEVALPDLESTDAGSEAFTGRARVLKELVEHHANEEEQEMFPLAQKLFSEEELEALGEQMLELKKQLTVA